MAKGDDDEIRDLREVVADLKELKSAISFVKDNQSGAWTIPSQLPARDVDWNFTTFEKYISQRFIDLSMNLRERFEAQQTGLAAALSAAEKAVNAALIAAEKAVDKAERAQELRNQVANEFRDSLSDLSALMWKATEGQVAESPGESLKNIEPSSLFVIKGVRCTDLPFLVQRFTGTSPNSGRNTSGARHAMPPFRSFLTVERDPLD